MLLDLRPAVPLVPHSYTDTDHAAGPLLLQVHLGGEAGGGLGADAVSRRQHEPGEQSQDYLEDLISSNLLLSRVPPQLKLLIVPFRPSDFIIRRASQARGLKELLTLDDTEIKLP